MRKYFKHSILLRLGLVMATITGLAIASMASSVFIADTVQGEVTAVNQAGTLRMQSYRIATYMTENVARRQQTYSQSLSGLVEEFEQRLQSPRLMDALPQTVEHSVQRAYDRVVKQWNEYIKPLLVDYIIRITPTHSATQRVGVSYTQDDRIEKSMHTGIRDNYLALVGDFVADIDQLVTRLEEDAESKIKRLRFYQGFLLFFTMMIVIVALHLIYANVRKPLKNLLACAESARHGNFSVRSHYTSENELGRLSHAFNAMAEDLSKIYTDLETRVQEKTVHLERSNRTLELLYNTVKRLNEAPIPNSTYVLLLRDIETVLGIGPGTICLAKPGQSKVIKLASSRRSRQEPLDLCSPSSCEDCFEGGATHEVEVWLDEDRPTHANSFPITDQDHQYGVLIMEVTKGTRLETWQKQLLEAVARHIGIAINISRRATESRRLALLEERSVIARELHDSLAQSLSYLKIQVTRLDAALNESENDQTVHLILKELRDGLSSAYRQLRELLTTFRLKMDGRDLHAMIEETVQEFRNRSDITIGVDDRIQHNQLSPNEEIHVLQVVREALSNVVRHARAEHAQVSMVGDAQGHVKVTIEDDGVGIASNVQRHHHYGLAIMAERTHSLGGTIDVDPRVGGGTRVAVEFNPNDRISAI